MRLIIFIIIGCVFFLQRAVGFTPRDEKTFSQSLSPDSVLVRQNEGCCKLVKNWNIAFIILSFNIGTIHFKVTNKEDRNGKVIYHAYAIMDSNPSLRLVSRISYPILY